LVVFLAIGCNDKDKHTALGKKPMGDKERIALEKNIGMLLPKDVVILVSDDGGGRDAKWQYHCWLFYSKSGIDLSPSQVASPSIASFLPNRDVKDVADSIQSIIPRTTLPTPTGASSLRWEPGTYEYRGTLLKTSDGDYLIVQRFKKQN